MKRILVLAFAAMALGSYGAQINWGSSGALYDGTKQMKTKDGYSTTAYLVYLGTSGATFGDINFATLADNAVATKTANALGTVSATSGNNVGFSIGDTIPHSTDTYAYNSSTFGIVYVMTNPTTYGEDRYYTTTGPFTLVNSGSTYAAATETTTLTAAVPSGTVWNPVTIPEPSSATLALAGLALLIKRRKAKKA